MEAEAPSVGLLHIFNGKTYIFNDTTYLLIFKTLSRLAFRTPNFQFTRCQVLSAVLQKFRNDTYEGNN